MRTIGFTYDDASQLLVAEDSDSSYTYQYDALGRVTSVDNLGTPGVPNVVLAYAYDAGLNRESVSDSLGGQIDYEYDALHRMTRVSQSGTNVSDKSVKFTYKADGQFDQIFRYAALTDTNLVADTAYSYDGAGRLDALTHTDGTATLAAYSLGYDLAGRITSFTSPDGTSAYNYDQTNQLTGADHTFQSDESYTYDANGNRTNTGYNTDPNNRLQSDGTFTYTYDDEGNRFTRTRISTAPADDFLAEYTWDHRNRLTKVTFKNNAGTVTKVVEYTYDVFDRRIERALDAGGNGTIDEQQNFVYDGEHVALAFDGAGSLTNRYLHGPVVDQILADDDGSGTVLWPLTDHQGTVRDIADSMGTVVNHIQYDSFGNVTSETDPATGLPPTQGSILDGDFPFAYTSREWDDAVDLYFYRARWYDPAVGRFVSEDPIGFAAGDANLSRYVGNSPTNATDPSGLEIKITVWPNRSKKQGSKISPNEADRLRRDFDAIVERAREDSDAFREYWDRLKKDQNIVIEINLTSGSNRVLVDHFADGAIDLADLARGTIPFWQARALDGYAGPTTEEWLMHYLGEQEAWARRNKGRPNRGPSAAEHNAGIRKQNEVRAELGQVPVKRQSEFTSRISPSGVISVLLTDDFELRFNYTNRAWDRNVPLTSAQRRQLEAAMSRRLEELRERVAKAWADLIKDREKRRCGTLELLRR